MPDSEKEFLYGPDEEAENTYRSSYRYKLISKLFPALCFQGLPTPYRCSNKHCYKYSECMTNEPLAESTLVFLLWM